MEEKSVRRCTVLCLDCSTHTCKERYFKPLTWGLLYALEVDRIAEVGGIACLAS